MNPTQLLNFQKTIGYSFIVFAFVCMCFSVFLIFDEQMGGWVTLLVSSVILLLAGWHIQIAKYQDEDILSLHKVWDESEEGKVASVTFHDSRFFPLLKETIKRSEYIEHLASTASKLGEGDFDAYFEIGHGNALLNQALDNMRNKLKTMVLKEQKAKWEIDQIAKISSILEKEHNSNSLANSIGSTLQEIVKVSCLSIWAINNINEHPTLYLPLYYSGYKELHESDLTGLSYIQSDLLIEQLNKKHQPKLAFNKTLQYSALFKEDKEDEKGKYHFITLPLVVNKQLYGFIEIGHTKRMSAEQMRFPRLVLEKISMGLLRIKSNEHMHFLLNEAQMLTEELRQREETLHTLNDNIQKQHSKVAESINYASHIQKAIVPTQEQMQKTLPHSFLLNTAKDKVSGDFPWFWENDDYIFIAAADCTGHGVPGAMISMMGYFLLEQLVGTYYDKHPAFILKKLDEYMMGILSSDTHFGNQISIDIGLCRLDKKSIILDFAGAYRPLYLQTKNGLDIIKGDRKTIGGGYKHIKKKMQEEFSTNSINLEEGDTFYLFTDGFVDQFGGGKDQKLSSRRLQKLIESYHNKPIANIGEGLSVFFQEWKGLRNQTDDMLILGIRV